MNQIGHDEYLDLTDKFMRIRTASFVLYVALFMVSFIYVFASGDNLISGGDIMLRFIVTGFVIVLAADLLCFLISLATMGRGYYHSIFIDTYFWLFFVIFCVYIYIFSMYSKGCYVAIALISFYAIYRGLTSPKRYYYMSVYSSQNKEAAKLKKPVEKEVAKEEKKSKKDTALLLAQEHLLASKKLLNEIQDMELRDDIRQLLNRVDAITTHFIITEAGTDEELKSTYSPLILKYAEYLSNYDFVFNRRQDIEQAMEGVKEVVRRIQSDIYKVSVSPETVEFINNDAKLRKLKD
jgi:hypothetical protein